ncbi:VOC family protein [Actinocorallia sp. A-T 12471]|uniref:VOC family protein n=1 Tax=Actinocorallia sp. A-T 12471 TaxID=3089813 RepID=UPI0029D179D3|nr:VOC family protein [Actinocorallia sp. A-T 12471]MDX6740647.1 VOC family protein [Actinocorallia sp. A-T 12471]
MLNSLNYIGFTSPRAADWTTFGPEVLGLQLAGVAEDGTVRLRMDDADYRIAIHPGATNEAAYLGWGVSSPADLAVLTERLAAVGIKTHAGDPAERAVAELIWFTDPFGQRHELTWGQLTRPASFHPGRAHAGFVTGDQGLGHAVLIVPDLAAADAFYRDVLGFRLSDQINAHGMRIRFYHCNGRHHSLALAEAPGAVGFHHLMLETRSIDDVGTALDLVDPADVTMGFGRHVNDQMLSFYLRTPSEFEIEYGFGGLVLDTDTAHDPRQYDSFSIWGHRFTTGAPTPPAIVRPFEGSEA